MADYNACGNCAHWQELKSRPYGLRQGRCAKVADGTHFECEGEAFFFGNVTFEDEVYDDCFQCFEERGADNG